MGCPAPAATTFGSVATWNSLMSSSGVTYLSSRGISPASHLERRLRGFLEACSAVAFPPLAAAPTPEATVWNDVVFNFACGIPAMSSSSSGGGGGGGSSSALFRRSSSAAASSSAFCMAMLALISLSAVTLERYSIASCFSLRRFCSIRAWSDLSSGLRRCLPREWSRPSLRRRCLPLDRLLLRTRLPVNPSVMPTALWCLLVAGIALSSATVVDVATLAWRPFLVWIVKARAANAI
mmetsp:Transcript_27383/g.53123  ORF Transcript_27383/g.53123 Transcript_27383/m.53123 type:complete len:237 (-) Transcript_27383:66-776(-)